MAHRCLLYVVYEPPHAALGFALARYGREVGDFHVIMWSPYWLGDTPAYRERAAQNGAIYVNENNSDGSLAGLHNLLSGWLSVAPARLRVAPPHRASAAGEAAVKRLRAEDPELEKTAQRVADRLERRIVIGEDWLVRLGVDALVLPEDNIERDSACWVESARRRGIPATVVTSGVLDPGGAEAVYRNSSAHAVPPAHLSLVREVLPHWLREGASYAVTRLPLPEAIGHELAGLSPTLPWLLNTGSYPRLALESAAMADDYRQHGYDESLLFATGHPSLDTLSARWNARDAARRELAETCGFDGAAPLCLIAVPPNRHATRESPEHPSYKGMIEAFVATAKTQWRGPVVASPHPAMTDEELSWITGAGGVLVRQPVAELIPLADLYVCGVSSTIKWALACGVPVLCYEAYRYDADMPALGSVKLAADLPAYGSALAELAELPQRQVMATRIRTIAPHWGRLDGRSLERVVSLCLDGPAG